MNNHPKIVAALLVTAALLPGAIITAGYAHADEDGYTAALQDDGIPTSATTLQLGHLICSDILVNGVDGVQNEVTVGTKNVGLADASKIITDAVVYLCPSAEPAVRQWISLRKNAGVV